MGLSHFDQVLWIASAILPILIVARVIHQRLYTAPFDAFVWMLGFLVLRDVVLASLHYDSRPYIVTWEATVPLVVIFQLNTGLRALKSIAQLYPAAGKFGIRLFVLCVTLAGIGCCLGLPFEFRHFSAPEVFLRTTFVLQRLVDSAIAGTLILVAVFLMWCPAPPKRPPRNIVLHTVLLTLYFGGYGALFFFENLVKLGSAQVLERIQFSLVVFTYCVWATALSAHGQRGEGWSDVEVFSLERVNCSPGPMPG